MLHKLTLLTEVTCVTLLTGKVRRSRSNHSQEVGDQSEVKIAIIYLNDH